jgi:hypothetical protein
VTIVLLAFSQYLLWLGYSTRRFSAVSPQSASAPPRLDTADGS